MKVICSPDVHESVQSAIERHHFVSSLEIIDYSDVTAQLKHKDATVIVAKKEYSKTNAMKQLKLFQVATAGYDKVDVRSLWSRGVAVCNNGGANSNAVAELTIASIISCLRNINYQHSSVIKNQWDCLKHNGEEFGSKTLGIIGYGKIGSRVAQLASTFGAKILAYDIDQVKVQSSSSFGVVASDLHNLLSNSDIVTVHIPLSKSNEGKINDTFFSKCKYGSIFVNMARGELQDEDAIIRNLDCRKLSAVILDVFTEEPYYNEQLFKYEDPSLTGRGSIFLPHTGPSKLTNLNLIDIINKNIDFVYKNKLHELDQVIWYD